MEVAILRTYNLKADFEGVDPYSYRGSDEIFLDQMNNLMQHHKSNCLEYSRIIDMFFKNKPFYENLEDIPFVPVRVFKEIDLLSTNRENIYKVMKSSGTSGQSPSRIFVDKETSLNQIYALSKIMTNFFGGARLPMLIIDSKETISNRKNFNARAAGILGFSMFGSELFYALKDDLSIDYPTIDAFLAKCQNSDGLVFGFTSIIWKHLISALKEKQTNFDLSHTSLLHGGGWKSMHDKGVSNDAFKLEVLSTLGINKVVNYYGMIEQTGSVFFECADGYLHTSVFSNVVIRDHRNFDSLPEGEWGLIQLQSLLPGSYPGHSILTEDIGMILPGFECQCGRSGKRIVINGRIPKAEVRGCSDTYEN